MKKRDGGKRRGNERKRRGNERNKREEGPKKEVNKIKPTEIRTKG